MVGTCALRLVVLVVDPDRDRVHRHSTVAESAHSHRRAAVIIPPSTSSAIHYIVARAIDWPYLNSESSNVRRARLQL